MLLSKLAIVDTTLREGEQFFKSNFSTGDKVEIARALEQFGVEYIEVTSPTASPQSYQDCNNLAKLGLQTKVITHIRCHLEDAKIALETGVDGINLFMGTSKFLRQFSHGKSIDEIIDKATEVITFIHQQNPQIELRFSTEDSFRSSLSDLLGVYSAINQLGIVHRFGVADTVGIATPDQVYQLIQQMRQCFSEDIEFHAHNDTGCAIANSFSAFQAGATHIDTTVLGIGERNGITPLAGLIARLYTLDSETLKQKYSLSYLHKLNQLVAEKIGLSIPFNHCIVGEAAFNHKAGVHTKAVLNNSQTYEAINPNDFNLNRSILINHKLAGKNSIAHRANELGLNLETFHIQAITQKIKTLAEKENITVDNVDEILYSYHQSIS
ncbi:homocitrate synthase [Okeania sp.]|uniref:homocitrate synthase n=1 Tax=Okeania sp. TaxID=3100323 RepID=UPI002B4AF923|nr:homocitrate synthase [Okeania sp.]MEB3342361.1 homocitrate synthase [Okeania sp.]